MWLKFALISALLTPLFHFIVLMITGQNPISTPVSFLSRAELGQLQSSALVLFGLAHIALAVGASGMDRGRLWPVARALLIVAGGGLLYVAVYFATASEAQLNSPGANNPLWVVASLTGLAMGAMQPGLARLSSRLGLISAMFLGIWILLVPLLFIVEKDWLGGYERIVGSVYVVWMAVVSSQLMALRRKSATDQNR